MDFEPLSQGVIDAAPDWMRAIPLRADGWRDENTRSVLATEAGAPVAVGMIWTSRVHGDRYWFEIAVDPAFRMRGHARDMFSHLTSLRAVDIPFMARGYANEDRMTFLRALGARTSQIVPPAHIDVAARSNLRPHPAVQSGANEGLEDDLDLEATSVAVVKGPDSPRPETGSTSSKSTRRTLRPRRTTGRLATWLTPVST